MVIVADHYSYVVGVDTHAATHHYAIIAAGTGALIDHAEFPTSPAGLDRAVAWIGRRTGGDLTATLISAEGTGSYGAQLTARLLATGYRVVDAPSPKRARGASKNDHLDAITAARGALTKPVESLADARAGELGTALRVLVTAREAMTTERTRAINALTALLRCHDLGVDARKKPDRTLIGQIARWRTRKEPLPLRLARAEATRLATRILALDVEVSDNEETLRTIVEQTVPSLLDLPGIGPVNAAVVLTAWSHPGRVRNREAFAKLAGVCPLQVASGQRSEHRLNRSGDRQLNRALHSIATSRMRYDPRTRDYTARRTTEGLTPRRIRRCLKRYIANEIYNHLEHHLNHHAALDTP